MCNVKIESFLGLRHCFQTLHNGEIFNKINLYLLTSIGKICVKIFSSIIKLLSMIKTALVFPNVKLLKYKFDS